MLVGSDCAPLTARDRGSYVHHQPLEQHRDRAHYGKEVLSVEDQLFEIIDDSAEAMAYVDNNGSC